MANDARSNRLEINRLTNAIAAEEQNINEIFRRMGQTYFASHRNDPEENQADNIKAILEAVERGKLYKEQINAIRGIAICPQCRAEVSITSLFCNHCGAKMPVKTPPAPATPAGPVCSRCGNVCAPGQRFCVNCGAPLAAPAQPQAPAYQPVPPVPPQAPVYQPVPPMQPQAPVYQPEPPAEPERPIYQPEPPAEPERPIYQPEPPAEPERPIYRPEPPA